MTTPAISIHGLRKAFGTVQALDGVDLVVQPGTVHGFLGPNGAGKSTTIRVLLGMLKADAGTVSVLGGNPWRDVVDLHSRLAYVPGDVSLWPGMTGGEAIDFLASLRGGIDPARRAELIEKFELDPTKRGRQYSKGNRQKVALVAALAADVELLILDEPTSGLDPLMENVFQDEVAAAKERGISVLLSSHILSEVESLADNVSIIRQGKIVRAGALHELRKNARTAIHATLRKKFFNAVPADTDPQLFHNMRTQGENFSATVDSTRLGEAMVALSHAGITGLTVEPPSLEELFLELYGEDAK